MLDKQKLVDFIRRAFPSAWIEFGIWLFNQWWAWVSAFTGVAALITAWESSPLEFKLMLYIVTATAAMLWWQSFSASALRKEKTAASTPAKSNEISEPLFLIRFSEKLQGYRGSVSDGTYDVLKITVTNAITENLDDVEVHITGKSVYISLRHVFNEKIPKIDLANRRNVSNFKPGQSEEYVLLSRHSETGETIWGDYEALKEPSDRKFVPMAAQHFIEVTILSKSKQPFHEKLIVITTGNKAEILPVFPEPAVWIWNG